MGRVATMLVGLLMVVPAVAADLPRAVDAEWIEVRSPDFVFVSAVGEARTRKLAEELEVLRSVLDEVLGGPLHVTAPARVYLFAGSRDFRPYKNLWRGEPAAVTGAYTRHGEADLIAVDGSAPDVGEVLFHEYIHLVAAHRWPGLPLWFEEGLAQLYQTFRLDRGRASLGLEIPEHRGWLASHRLMPLEELLAVTRSSPRYNEREKKGAFYAESWALVHYLVLGDETRRPQLIRYLDLVRRGAGVADAFEQAFGEAPRELERRLAGYAARPRWPEGGFDVGPIDTPVARVGRLGRDEALCRLGDLLSAQEPPRLDEAADHFRAALQENPGSGRALAGLALVAESRARWERAEDFYRRAVAVAPEDPGVLYRWGHFALRRGASREEGLEALRRSVTLEPGLGGAWLDLARALLATPGTEAEGLVAATRASELLPGRRDAAMVLVEAALRAGRRELAMSAADRMFVASSPGRLLARQAVARADLERVRRLLLDGRLDDAEAVLARTRRELPEAVVSGPLEESAAELETELVLARRVARLDRAQQWIADGAWGEARRELTELAAGSDGVARRAASLLAELDRPTEPPPTPLPEPPGLATDRLDELNALVAAGELDGALDLLLGMRDVAAPNQRPWLDRKASELRRAIRHNAFVDRYNRAVDLVNEGRPAQAEEVLRSLLAGDLEPEDEAAARDLLAKVE